MAMGSVHPINQGLDSFLISSNSYDTAESMAILAKAWHIPKLGRTYADLGLTRDRDSPAGYLYMKKCPEARDGKAEIAICGL